MPETLRQLGLSTILSQVQGSPLTMQTQHLVSVDSNVFLILLLNFEARENVWSAVKAGILVRNRIKKDVDRALDIC